MKRFIGIGASDGLQSIVMREELKPFYGTLGQRALEQRQLLPGVGRVNLAFNNDGRANGSAIVQTLREQAAFNVNWAERTCSCGLPQTLGVPCVHVYAVEREVQVPPHVVAQFTARGVLRAHLLSAMQHKIKPVAINMSQLQRDGLRKGPVVLADGSTQSAKKRGRPSDEKARRTRSASRRQARSSASARRRRRRRRQRRRHRRRSLRRRRSRRCAASASSRATTRRAAASNKAIALVSLTLTDKVSRDGCCSRTKNLVFERWCF